MNMLTRPKLLIVDDEPNIRHVLERTLRDQGYDIALAVDGEDALLFLNKGKYDLMLLDLRMHGVSGLQVLKAARQQDPELVVIILTAHGSLETAVDALRLGAFDYLIKPATPSVIRERVHAGILQRQRTLHRKNIIDQIESLKQLLLEMDASEGALLPPNADIRFIRSGKLTIDLHHRSVTLDDQTLDLTTTEFDLLACLVKASPEPVSARALLANAMGYSVGAAEAKELVKWHIHHLRQKIEPDMTNPQYIKTVRYKGYLWSGQ